MNLGGASNVDLTEAARLMKQSAGGAGVPNQQVPPPMMLMQQAVAMQQFQFQQALLMQQVMATQQAAARAATVKSAQEMASARAAEISKQLKGNDPDVEEEKKSPVRSRSGTPTHSRSRSFSRSKSRSPLRYRRDRSASRSPIRYRRDLRPSPSRSRDYYGYRGRSRRGFYRGRGEYPWNPSFRRDWERDRDHYSSRSRRSRSHSRSRVRRRSHTRSRSPRGRRDRSVTPPRYRHEDRRSGRSSRRSKSIEAKASPSHSSRSRSESLHKEDTSRSPPAKSRVRVGGKDSRKEEKSSPEPTNGVHALIRSPAMKDYREKVHQDDGAGSKGKEATEDMKVQMKGRDELSVSPARSLSVSLSPPTRSRETNMDILEDVNRLSDRKKNAVQDTVGERTNEGLSVADVAWKKLSSPAMIIEGAVSDAEASLEPEIDVKGVTKGKSVDFGVKGRYVRKESGRSEFPSDESDGDKEVDDWRDDIKANELEKIKRMENKRELERREEERKAIPAQPIVVEDVRDYGVTLLEHLGKGRKAPVQKALDSELLGDHDILEKMRKEALSKQYIHVETVHSLEGHLNGSKVVIGKEEMQQRGYMGHGGRDRGVKEDTGGIIKEKSPESTDVAERDEDDDVVFEGPKLAYEEVCLAQVTELCEKGDDSLQDIGREIHNSLTEEDSAEEMGAELPPSLLEMEEVGVQKGKDKGRLRDEEEVRGTHRGKSRVREGDELYSGSKVKETSRSRERSRRHEDEVDRERRKEKHRKHKRKHRRDEETEKDDDDDEDDKRDGDGGKDKEERRHRSSRKHRSGREHNDEKRDKRKRRHKHRGKSPSESLEKEVLVGEIEGAADVDQMVGPVLNRHMSSCENRRKDVSKSSTHGSGSASE